MIGPSDDADALVLTNFVNRPETKFLSQLHFNSVYKFCLLNTLVNVWIILTALRFSTIHMMRTLIEASKNIKMFALNFEVVKQQFRPWS